MPTKPPERPLRWYDPSRLTRDGVLFVAGLAGIIYEAVHSATERPWLLAAYLTMMGVSVPIRADERRRRSRREREG